MIKKVCIFVDGENFRHAIVDLFENFNKEDYLPKQAEWTKWFDHLVSEVGKKVCSDTDRVRTYWYVIDQLDFFPYRIPKMDREPDKLKRLLSKHPPYEQKLNAATDQNTLYAEMDAIVTNLKRKQNSMRKRFDGWRTIQYGIANRHDAVEFRRAGSIGFNLFNFELGKEKAVDVKLAVDMIVLKDNYDIALVVSGDQDYVPAVQVVKDYGKKVVNVAFETRNGKLLPGGAWRLNQITDWNQNVKHSDLKGFLFPDEMKD